MVLDLQSLCLLPAAGRELKFSQMGERWHSRKSRSFCPRQQPATAQPKHRDTNQQQTKRHQAAPEQTRTTTRASSKAKGMHEKGKRNYTFALCPLPFALCLPRRGCLTATRKSNQAKRENQKQRKHQQQHQKRRRQPTPTQRMSA